MSIKTNLASIFIYIFLGLSVSAQEKPEWRFSILASVSDSTAAFYGSMEIVKEKINAQFKIVNSRYNDPDVFTGRFNFVVDSVNVFSGLPSRQYSNPLVGFDFQIVYDMYHSPRASWIGPPINSVAFHIPYSEGFPDILALRFAKIITHELGHARGGVDLYGMAISSLYNEVNSQEFKPEESIMSSASDSIWSEHTINIINYNSDYVKKDYDENGVKRFFNSRLGLRVVGSLGETLENVKVKLYPHTWYDYIIKDSLFESGTTNEDGIFLFKNNPYTIYDNYEYSINDDYYGGPPFGLTHSLILAKIINDSQQYYFWLPFTIYQNKYFSENSDTALVTLTLNTVTSNSNSYFKLFQNYPNPFNASTDICLSMMQPAKVKIDIYNLLGQKETNLFSGVLETGIHCYQWNGAVASSGVYFVVLSVEGENDCKKMMLLK